MKTISIVTDFFTDKKGRVIKRGSAIQLFNLLKVLHNNGKFNFEVYQMADKSKVIKKHGIKINSIECNSIEQYKNTLKDKNLDIVHFNNIDLFFKTTRKSSAIIHTNVFISKPEAKRFLIEDILPFVHKIIVVNTEYLKEFNIYKEKFVFIPNGINLKYFPFTNKKRLQQNVNLLFPNIITANKNFPFAVKLRDSISEKYPIYNFKLVCLGKKSKKVTNILIHRYKNNRSMHKLYSKAHFCLIPSFSESCSLCALESMACGTIVLASNIYGLNEYVENNETGFLFQLDEMSAWVEKIIELISDLKKYNYFAQKARLHIEELRTVEISAKKYLELWESINY